jgi:NadR type nicotinamide-nucleotide adenylyltransferase
VVFLGAESTGKSTLAEQMALEFDTEFVAEYGRVHYEHRGGRLDLEDYVTIATRHREHEDDACLRAHRYLFVDTNAITTMFFSHYYNRDSLPALRALADDCRARYRHVIVCDDDIAFAQDGWRDNDIWRARMQGMVLHDLAVREIDYRVVRGTLAERVEQVKAILAGGAGESSPPRPSLGPRPR